MIKLFNGNNELAMQRLTFGPNTYGDEENMDKYLMFLDMYTEAGGTSVDTARVYSAVRPRRAAVPHRIQRSRPLPRLPRKSSREVRHRARLRAFRSTSGSGRS